jgi:signal transduction histidine kinase
MNEGELVREVERELGGGDGRGLLTTVLGEILHAVHVDGAISAESTSLSGARAFGVARAEAGQDLEPTLRELQEMIRAALQALARHGEDAATLSRLLLCGEEAVVQAAAGWETRRRDSREAWLSYLVHDLKNPLNTVLNALGLIRSRGELPEASGRFVQMIERAARRIEEGLGTVRGLERKTVDTPDPPWRRGKQ